MNTNNSQSAPRQSRPPINAVFAGGGIKGLALAGAGAGALHAGYGFGHIVGTSAGAMVASLLAAGYTAAELRAAVAWISWPHLFDWHAVTRVPLVGKALAMAWHKAQVSGDRIESTWRQLLAAKGVATFADLPAGRLRVVATDLTHQRGVVFPDDLGRYGLHDLEVAVAVRMSAAVPFVLQPVPLKHPLTRDLSLIADGALTANFPVRVARRSDLRPVVGFRFIDRFQHRHLNVRGPASLARAVVGAGIIAGDALRHDSDATIVDLVVDRDPLDFDLSPDDAIALFDAGHDAAVSAMSELDTGHIADAHATSSLRGPER